MKKKHELVASYGTDPELHVHSISEGRIVSAIPLLQRDKYNPIDLGDGIHTYHDNVLVEFSCPPSDNIDNLIEQLKRMLTRGQDVLGSGYRFMPKAAHEYDADQLQDERATVVGCNPSYNAWAESMNPPKPFEDNVRTGSFHVHVGNRDFAKLRDKGPLLTYQGRINAVRALDILLGVPSVIFDRDETSEKRRLKYGGASEHRPTTFGIEYRVLSPYALRSPSLVKLVGELVDHTLDHIREGTEEDLIKSVNPDEIQHTINRCDYTKALEIAKKVLPAALFKKVTENRGLPDLSKEWGLV